MYYDRNYNIVRVKVFISARTFVYKQRAREREREFVCLRTRKNFAANSSAGLSIHPHIKKNEIKSLSSSLFLSLSHSPATPLHPSISPLYVSLYVLPSPTRLCVHARLSVYACIRYTGTANHTYAHPRPYSYITSSQHIHTYTHNHPYFDP